MWYAIEGEQEQALSSYSLAAPFNEGHAEALKNLDVMYKDMGYLDKSIELYKRGSTVTTGIRKLTPASPICTRCGQHRPRHEASEGGDQDVSDLRRSAF